MKCQNWSVGSKNRYDDVDDAMSINLENIQTDADVVVVVVQQRGKADVIRYNRSFIEQILPELARYNKRNE